MDLAYLKFQTLVSGDDNLGKVYGMMTLTIAP